MCPSIIALIHLLCLILTLNNNPATTGVAKYLQTEGTPNAYFFQSDTEVPCQISALFTEDDKGVETGALSITLVSPERSIYEVKLITDHASIPEERKQLGYFMVTSDKIYKINCSFPIDKIEEHNLLAQRMVVCTDSKQTDKFYGLTRSGTQCAYWYVNNAVESGYYEGFTWQKGVGLIHYESGFGAERDSIKVDVTPN